MIWGDVLPELVLRDRDVDRKVSVVLSAVFLFVMIVILALLTYMIIRERQWYHSVHKWIWTFIVGMKEKRYKSVLFYYVWFFTIWMLLAVSVVLIGIVSPIICASIFLGLVIVSFLVHSIRKYFTSWFWHIANWLLELSLLIIGCMTVYEEVKGTNDTMGIVFVIFFTIIQIIVFILVVIDVIITLYRWIRETCFRSNKIKDKMKTETSEK